MDSQTGDQGYFSEEHATFGDRLTAAREALGLTQAELAGKLGVKLKTLRAWEDDISEPRANRLQMLAGILNVSITWLITGSGDGLYGPPDAHPTVSGSDLMVELRAIRTQQAQLADRLAHFEKALTRQLGGDVESLDG